MDYPCLGFFANMARDAALQAVAEAVETAAVYGYTCVAEGDLAQKLSLPDFSEAKPEVLFAFGGDGTILRAAARAVSLNIPVCGVNFGRIGFLSEADADSFETLLRAYQERKYRVETCMLLCCTLQDGREFLCVNDALLYKRAFSGVIDINVNIDGIDAGTVFCDGIVISTPIGATGYSISAGGPVIAPGLEATIITPICPHSLCFRPIIAAPDAKLRFVMHSPGFLAVDGERVARLHSAEEIYIGRAEACVKFLHFFDRNLYTLIRKKLS